jgi:hypothetical protein
MRLEESGQCIRGRYSSADLEIQRGVSLTPRSFVSTELQAKVSSTVPLRPYPLCRYSSGAPVTLVAVARLSEGQLAFFSGLAELNVEVSRAVNVGQLNYTAHHKH